MRIEIKGRFLGALIALSLLGLAGQSQVLADGGPGSTVVHGFSPGVTSKLSPQNQPAANGGLGPATTMVPAAPAGHGFSPYQTCKVRLHDQPTTKSAGVTSYNSTNTGTLAAAYVNNVSFDGATWSGYQLRGSADGIVGWNIPNYGGTPLNFSNFDYAALLIPGRTNYNQDTPSATAPNFDIVVQDSSGFYHTLKCTNNNGYDFVGNFSQVNAAYNQFNPAIDNNNITIESVAFMYFGEKSRTTMFNLTIIGSPYNLVLLNNGYPNTITQKMTPDTKFNFEP